MNIIVTDGYTLNPGDLSWDEIRQFGDLTIYDRTSPDLLEQRCLYADIVLTNKTPFSKSTLEKLPQLKMIGVTATGYNIIDTSTAKEKAIIVCNAPAYGTASVAQHAFALILELANQVGIHAQSVAAGKWQQSADWCFNLKPVTELFGKTLGIIGFGNIGQQTARIAAAFGMKVIYHTPRKKENALAEYADMETLFSSSDAISLHCPLQPDNREFVNAGLLRLMKPTAWLVNTARGQLINEQDLADALNNNIIAGAGLDVLSAEPPAAGNPLLSAKNCIITPHNAWISREARMRIMDITRNNIVSFLQGKPVNRVN